MFLLQILGKTSEHIHGLRVGFQDHLQTPVLLQLTTANTSKDSWALAALAFPHPDHSAEQRLCNPESSTWEKQEHHTSRVTSMSDPKQRNYCISTPVHDDWAALKHPNECIKTSKALKPPKVELACNSQAWPKRSACTAASCQLYSHCNSSIPQAFLCWDTRGGRKLGTTHSTTVCHLETKKPCLVCRSQDCSPPCTAIDIYFRSSAPDFPKKNGKRKGSSQA